jgi:hypothetical protein
MLHTSSRKGLRPDRKDGFTEGSTAAVSYSKRHLVCLFVTLRMRLKLLLPSVFGVIASRMTSTSCWITLVLVMCTFLVATLICWPGGGRPASANDDSAAPTFDFHADQLEVETGHIRHRNPQRFRDRFYSSVGCCANVGGCMR